MKSKTSTSNYGQQNLRISKVKKVTDGSPKTLEIPWQDVIERCFEPDVHGDLNHSEYLKARKVIRNAQKDGTAIIGGAFSKLNTRTTDDMESYCLTILDFDDGHYTFDKLVKALAGIECVVFTTYSHSKYCGKFRALVLLDKPIRENIKATLDEIIDYFETFLGPHIDKACRTPSHVFYAPACPPGGKKYFRSEHIAGKPLRTADFKISIPDIDTFKKTVFTVPDDCSRPGSDFNKRATLREVSALMVAAGWHEHSVKGDLIHLTRPGKSRGISATCGFYGTNFLYIHTTNKAIHPFEARKGLKPFHIYAITKHDSDYSAAARQLAAEGYGKQQYADSGQNSATIDTCITDCPVLPKEAMPGWIGEFVKLVCKDSEVHPSAVLIALLLRFCAEILGPFIRIGDAKHRARTNAVIVGATSKARKGTSFAPIGALFAGLENSARVSPGPLSTGEGLIEAVRDERSEFDKKKQIVVIVDPGVTDKRLFVLDEELANALASMHRKDSTLSGVIRRFWDDGDLEPLNRHDKYKTTGAHVVILTHITKLELASNLDKVQMTNGFANRFLWLLVHRTKNVALPHPFPAKELENFRKIIVERIKAAKGLGEMHFSEKTRKLYTEVYDELTTEYPGVAGAIVGRSEAHVIRLALIYALAAGHSEIKTQDLKAALALVKTSNESVFTIFKDKGDDKAGRQCDNRKDKILRALRNATDNKLSKTEIHGVFNRKEISADIDKTLQELVSSEEVTIEKEKTGGADKTIYRLVP